MHRSIRLSEAHYPCDDYANSGRDELPIGHPRPGPAGGVGSGAVAALHQNGRHLGGTMVAVGEFSLIADLLARFFAECVYGAARSVAKGLPTAPDDVLDLQRLLSGRSCHLPGVDGTGRLGR